MVSTKKLGEHSGAKGTTYLESQSRDLRRSASKGGGVISILHPRLVSDLEPVR